MGLYTWVNGKFQNMDHKLVPEKNLIYIKKNRPQHLGHWCLIGLVSFPKLFRKKYLAVYRSAFQNSRRNDQGDTEYSYEVSETKHWVSIFQIKTSNFWFSLLLSIHEKPQAKQAPIKSKPLAPSHSQNSPPPPTLPCN